jgi:hypothetical protein
MDYGLFNPFFLGINDRRLERLHLDLSVRRLLARIVRTVDFVGLSCTDGSSCLPKVNGIDRMFSFLYL